MISIQVIKMFDSDIDADVPAVRWANIPQSVTISRLFFQNRQHRTKQALSRNPDKTRMF